jgi:gluconokinase
MMGGMDAQRDDGTDDQDSSATHVVVMGVSGSGKSTVAVALARRLGWEFGEGDAFHPAENIEKMATGTPLTDEDRVPWLERLAAWIGVHEATGRSTVLACSALRRAYRDVLRSGGSPVRFIHLTGPDEVLAERMGDRDGHFMPGSLLHSQLDTLEALQPDEDALVLDVRSDPDVLVDTAVRWLR